MLKKNKMRKKGFILIFSIMMIAIAMIVSTQLLYKIYIFNGLITITLQKEKAKLLALSGLSIATSQLLLLDKKIIEDEKKNKESKENNVKDFDKNHDEKKFFKMMLTINNCWQSFILTKKDDDIEGSIDLYVSCENGKININEIYDFQKHSFIKNNLKDGEKLLKEITDRCKFTTKNDHLFDMISNYLKSRKGQLPDLSLILDKKEFNILKDSFYLKDKMKNDKNSNLFFSDIFTIWPSTDEVNPFLISNSLKRILDISSNDVFSGFDNDTILSVTDKIKSFQFDWNKDASDYLQPLYMKDFKNMLKDIVPYFSNKFEASFFSVLSCGKIGNVEQRVIAILQRSLDGKNVKIEKIYWL